MEDHIVGIGQRHVVFPATLYLYGFGHCQPSVSYTKLRVCACMHDSIDELFLSLRTSMCQNLKSRISGIVSY